MSNKLYAWTCHLSTAHLGVVQARPYSLERKQALGIHSSPLGGRRGCPLRKQRNTIPFVIFQIFLFNLDVCQILGLLGYWLKETFPKSTANWLKQAKLYMILEVRTVGSVVGALTGTGHQWSSVLKHFWTYVFTACMCSWENPSSWVLIICVFHCRYVMLYSGVNFCGTI